MLEDTGRVARQAVFRTLNQRLHEVAPEGAVTCRSGYDELAIVMPGASDIDARDRATAVQLALSALAYGGRDTVHVPAGIAACVQGRHTVGELVQRAQSALERSRGLPGTPTVIASLPSGPDGTSRR
jgi:GGDEF domain-containing protein